MRKSISDKSKFLRILHIDEKSLDTWFKNGENMARTTKKLRQKIKLHKDHCEKRKASNTPQKPLRELGKRKLSDQS